MHLYVADALKRVVHTTDSIIVRHLHNHFLHRETQTRCLNMKDFLVIKGQWIYMLIAL